MSVAPQHLASRLDDVRDSIAAACARAGRPEGTVELCAVTKGRPVATMQAIVELGCRDLGENRVQEALPKLQELPAQVRVHLIGRLQTNKVAKVVGVFASVESVDRLRLLQALARRARALECEQTIWIEVNASGEAQKGGCAPDKTADLWDAALAEEGISPVGLMTLARADADEATARATFARLRRLGEGLRRRDGSPPGLSMGMSRDFEWAILEGSTQVRLGSALFGPREVAGM